MKKLVAWKVTCLIGTGTPRERKINWGVLRREKADAITMGIKMSQIYAQTAGYAGPVGIVDCTYAGRADVLENEDVPDAKVLAAIQADAEAFANRFKR